MSGTQKVFSKWSFHYYCFWAGELRGDGGGVPSTELPAEVCVGRWGDCSLGACLEEALGIGYLEEGKG